MLQYNINKCLRLNLHVIRKGIIYIRRQQASHALMALAAAAGILAGLL